VGIASRFRHQTFWNGVVASPHPLSAQPSATRNGAAVFVSWM
jgi:hypothetical protein